VEDLGIFPNKVCYQTIVHTILLLKMSVFHPGALEQSIACLIHTTLTRTSGLLNMIFKPNLTIAIYNINCLRQGWKGTKKCQILKDHLTHLNPKPDTILFQEHRFLAEDYILRTQQLDFLNGSSFWNKASFNAIKNRWSAGTSILINHRFIEMV
jgi:hypothetical protein